MGQFSWITSNTKQRIIIDGYMPVALIDKDNNLYKEENYQGYGVFGGKDAYELLAEMNAPELCTGDTRHDRQVGIDLQYSGKPIVYPIKIVELIPGKPIKYPIKIVELIPGEDYDYNKLDPAEDDPFQGWEVSDDEEEGGGRWY